MRQIKWYLHPIFIFIFSIVALGLSLFLYIYWYVEVSARLQGVVKNFNLDPGQFLELETWVVIVVLSILVAIIMIGIFIIFAFNVKMLRLYRLQHNFINNFTHELKTPVTSMKLYLETFQKHELPRAKQLKYIEYMLSDVSRLSDNINSILNLAKLESKLYELNLVRVDLVGTVEQFCRQNRHLFQNCEIKIHSPINRTFYYPVDLPLFEMLLMNLLTNAIKYNDSKKPRVDIIFSTHGKHLNISIKDNGIGLRRRERKKIFKKFYRLEKTEKSRGEGSGLGLYFVDNIVRIHHGRIKAESQGPGLGTTMIINLDLNQTDIPSPKLLRTDQEEVHNAKAHPDH